MDGTSAGSPTPDLVAAVSGALVLGAVVAVGLSTRLDRSRASS